jgi:hypothetical protein
VTDQELLDHLGEIGETPTRFKPQDVWRVTASGLALNGQAHDIVRSIRDTIWTPARFPDLLEADQRVCDICGRAMKSVEVKDGLVMCKGRAEWWCEVVAQARRIAGSYDTAVGIRQIHYRLMSARDDYHNSRYGGLSSQTAMTRRLKTFPRLSDSTRKISRALSWEDAADAKQWLAERFRVDRTRGQDTAIYIALEKRGLMAQFEAWFRDPFGIPIIPLGGVSSESIEGDVIEDAIRDGRKHANRRRVLLIATDFDASGEFIPENFEKNVGRYFTKVHRVALTADQVIDMDLPVVEGTGEDEETGRCKNGLWPAFRDKHWDLLVRQASRHPRADWDCRVKPNVAGQIEMDAIDPNDLRDMFRDAIADPDLGAWNDDAYQEILDVEEEERENV